MNEFLLGYFKHFQMSEKPNDFQFQWIIRHLSQLAMKLNKFCIYLTHYRRRMRVTRVCVILWILRVF